MAVALVVVAMVAMVVNLEAEEALVEVEFRETKVEVKVSLEEKAVNADNIPKNINSFKKHF